MPLGQRRSPFDHPEWIFELKYDGFRSLAYVDGGGTKLVSRRLLPYRQFADLASDLALEVNVDDAVLDGEIVKLDSTGRSAFLDVIHRRGPFTFAAFDVLALNGKDVRKLPLTDRKGILRAIIDKGASSVFVVDQVEERGVDLYRAVRESDLEGMVAKWTRGRYDAGAPVPSWVKIKNPEYSQARNRQELFAARP